MEIVEKEHNGICTKFREISIVQQRLTEYPKLFIMQQQQHYPHLDNR